MSGCFAGCLSFLRAPQPEKHLLVDKLLFAEAPRWHAGKLFFSDMHGFKVHSVAEDGTGLETEFEGDSFLSGLGWLPSGQMLVVDMVKRQILAIQKGGPASVYADMGELMPSLANDMCIHSDGTAYVGHFGYDLMDPNAEKRKCYLIRVKGKGTSSTEDGGAFAKDGKGDLLFPNGTVITPDGKTLIVAETFNEQLTAYCISDTGALTDRRVWAPLPGAIADGIALDADGCIWVACNGFSPGRLRGFGSVFYREFISKRPGSFLRVQEGGKVLQRIDVSTSERGRAYACMLGGQDGRTLFMLESGADCNPAVVQAKGLGNSCIYKCRVDVGAARRLGDPRFNAGYC